MLKEDVTCEDTLSIDSCIAYLQTLKEDRQELILKEASELLLIGDGVTRIDVDKVLNLLKQSKEVKNNDND